MRRRISTFTLLLAILAAVVSPAGDAEAKWVTADNRVLGDPLVCRDAMSIGLGVWLDPGSATVQNPPSQVNYTVTAKVKSTQQQIASQTVVLQRAPTTPFDVGTGQPLDYIGFPMLRWSEAQPTLEGVPYLLPAGTQVVLTGYANNYTVTVQDCLFYLDSLQRADGLPGANWSGNSSSGREYGYYIRNHQLDVDLGGPLYWRPPELGYDQEAWVRIANLDSDGAEQGLLLKVQPGSDGKPNWRAGAIKIVREPASRIASWRIRVSTYTPGSTTWRDWGAINTSALASGDVLQARVVDNQVYILRSNTPPAPAGMEVMRNTTLLGRFTIDPFFSNRSGLIGLWFQNAGDATIHSFGGGKVVADGVGDCDAGNPACW
jgi:hypothetical protein